MTNPEVLVAILPSLPTFFLFPIQLCNIVFILGQELCYYNFNFVKYLKALKNFIIQSYIKNKHNAWALQKGFDGWITIESWS